jgi:succinate dehydrogenase / fumarate reductase membrane anchor subunit
MVSRTVVGAHYGLKDWLYQRITAIIIAVYAAAFVFFILPRFAAGFDSWRAAFSGVFVRISTLLFLFALLMHAWVGVRDIFMDYVKPVGLRLFLQIVVILALIVYGLWGIIILGGA